MSSHLGSLTSLLLREVFGDIVGNAGDLLSQWNKRNLSQILSSGKPKICESLAVLIHHNIVTFAESERNSAVEYTIHHDKVIALLRYPRFLLLCRTLFDMEGEVLIEEICKHGQVSASGVIYASAKKLKSSSESSKLTDVVQKLRTTFNKMANCQFIVRCPSPYTSLNPSPKPAKSPKLELNKDHMFVVPEIDLKAVNTALDADIMPENLSDKNILWAINYDRFNREFRDQVLVQAVSRRIDSSAGNLMRVILNIMNEAVPWAPVSNDIHQTEIFRRVNTAEMSSSVGADGKLQAYHEQYLKVLEEDRVRFIDRVGDAGGGQYVVNVKHIMKELAAATVDNIVLEKFGSKALRIFRVIREKVHVEESQLQGLVMIPAKEMKELTYQLLENNFIQLQELRKSMSANAISKCFYLFYIDMNQVSRMIIDHCHKAIFNAIIRKRTEAETNQRLLDKHERVESIALTIKNTDDFDQSEELQAQLQEIQDMLSPAERDSVSKIHANLDQLSRAAAQVDETLFIMNMYIFYESLTS